MAYRYLIFYKPYDVLSQFTDEQGRTTLKNFIPVNDVYPVGRLDRDSEGLMLLSDHAQVNHHLTEPKFGHPRTYWTQVERVPDPSSLKKLCQGVVIRGYRTRPATVMLLPEPPPLPSRTPPIRYRKQVPTAWLQITLTEGKNRQVRRMTAAVGFPTLRLVRVGIAHLHLEGLNPGQWRYLSGPEQRQLLTLIKRPRAQISDPRRHAPKG